MKGLNPCSSQDLDDAEYKTAASTFPSEWVDTLSGTVLEALMRAMQDYSIDSRSGIPSIP